MLRPSPSPVASFYPATPKAVLTHHHKSVVKEMFSKTIMPPCKDNKTTQAHAPTVVVRLPEQVIRGWFGRKSVRIRKEDIRRRRRQAVEAVWYVRVLGAMERSIIRFDKVCEYMPLDSGLRDHYENSQRFRPSRGDYSIYRLVQYRLMVRLQSLNTRVEDSSPKTARYNDNYDRR